MDKLRVAIIGGGSIAQVHLEALAQSQYGQVVAVAEPDPETRTRWQGKGVRVEADFRALLWDKSIEVVDLCLPHFLHEPVALEAFAAGKDVIVEKPAARRASEADSMLAGARVANRRLVVSHNQLFQPTHRRMKEMLQAGEIGRPFLGVLTVIGDELARMNDPDHWKGDEERAGGGVMIDTGMHAVYLLQYLLGEVRAVTAVGRRLLVAPPSKGEDNAVVTLEFDEAIASITVTYTATGHPWYERREIHGPAGALYSTEDPDSVLTLVTRQGVEEVMRLPNTWRQSIAASLDNALEAIATGKEAFVSDEMVRQAMSTMDAVYRSMAEGRRVAVGAAA